MATKKQSGGEAGGLKSIWLGSSHRRVQKHFRHYGRATHQHLHLPERNFMPYILLGTTAFTVVEAEKFSSTWGA